MGVMHKGIAEENAVDRERSKKAGGGGVKGGLKATHACCNIEVLSCWSSHAIMSDCFLSSALSRSLSFFSTSQRRLSAHTVAASTTSCTATEQSVLGLEASAITEQQS